MISRHSKTYNFFHRVLLFLNCGREQREAVCLTGVSSLLFEVLDKTHLQETDIWVSPCNRTSSKPPTRLSLVKKLPQMTGARIC